MKPTRATYLIIFTMGLIALKPVQNAQAQQVPIQSDQLPPEVVDAAKELAESLGQDLDTVLKNNPAFAKKASSSVGPEFFNRINNLIQDADTANTTPAQGSSDTLPQPNTVDGIRSSLELNTINNSDPVPANQTTQSSTNTSGIPSSTATAPSSTNADTSSNTTSSPETNPEEIPVKNIPLGDLAQ